MAIDTASKTGRRQIADEFKSRKVTRGIYAVRCSRNGQTWVGSSPNLAAAKNSLWFQLGTGRFRNAPLQKAWQDYGEAAFNLEVLEQFHDEVSPFLLADLYLAGKKRWAEQLSAEAL